MESFLSLPRSAKAGLAVLLAVALLGWGIVAYSSKRQHEDAKSLQQALATIDGKNEAEQTIAGELEDARTRLAATETDLSSTIEARNELEGKISQLEADLDEREQAISDLSNQIAAIDVEGGEALASGQQLGLLGNQQAGVVDVATLRERLTTARTTLSARSATLAQRDRELEQAKADFEEAEAKIASLEEGLVEQGVLRERLQNTMTTLSGRTATLAQRDRELEQAKADIEAAETQIASLEEGLIEQGVLRERLQTTMTTLSGRTATLAQRDRELERAKADYEAANATIASLEADLLEQGVLRERLSKTMTKLSGQSAMLAQRDRDLAKLSEDHETLKSQLAAFETDASARAEAERSLESVQLRVDRTEQALKEATGALDANQQKIRESETRIAALQSDFETVQTAVENKEKEFGEREQALVELGEKIEAEEAKLADLASTFEQRKSEVEEAKQQLADLQMAKSEIEAGISSLTAELEQQEVTLSDKEDAIAYADTRLAKLKDEAAMMEERISGTEAQLTQKTQELNDRQSEIDAVKATLKTLKEERSATTTEAAGLRDSIEDQEAVLKDLEIAKGDLKKTRTELNYQQALLIERQDQIQLAEDRLGQLQQAIQGGVSRNQTVARIPIAAISTDNPAVLPIDPMYEAFPVQTPLGVRLTQVHFDMGSAELTPGGLRKAKDAAEWIKTQDVEKIRLVGFTDSIGTKANNRSLAKRRATSLLRVFEEQGIDPKRIEIIAKGEVGTREVTEDHTAEPLNRCVGVFIGADG